MRHLYRLAPYALFFNALDAIPPNGTVLEKDLSTHRPPWLVVPDNELNKGGLYENGDGNHQAVQAR